MEAFIEELLPSYETQRDILLEHQAGQRDFMNGHGMIDRAAKLVPHYDEAYLHHISLSLSRLPFGGSEEMRKINIRFGERRIDRIGRQHVHARYLTIGQQCLDMVYPNQFFEEDEVEEATELLDELLVFKHEKVLPDLDDGLTYIRNPNAQGWNPEY